MARGELYWLQVQDDKRRPVLVVSADPLVAALRKVLVVPLATSVRDVPTEVVVGPRDGAPRDCAANANDAARSRALLVERVTVLGPDGMIDVCAALRRATGC